MVSLGHMPRPSQRFQAMEESHLQHMKALLGSYAHSVEDTHVQIGQVRMGPALPSGPTEATPPHALSATHPGA